MTPRNQAIIANIKKSLKSLSDPSKFKGLKQSGEMGQKNLKKSKATKTKLGKRPK